MRQLSLQEISSVSGAEKALFEMTPTDLIPYVAAYLGGTSLGEIAKTNAATIGVLNNTIGLFGSNVAGFAAGAVGCFLLAKLANDKIIQPYVV